MQSNSEAFVEFAPFSASCTAVLIVEDEQGIRDSFEDLLRGEGYAVVAAENGLQALDALRAGLRVDVILLDLMMPVMDGWEFRLRQRNDVELASIPVVAVSADTTAKAAAIDADAYLVKPVALDTLLATIDRIVLARERAAMRSRVMEAERLGSLGRLAAGVAHEINNPLAYVTSNIDYVRERIEELKTRERSAAECLSALDDAAAALREASDGLTRIRGIVRDMRCLSRAGDESRAPVDVRRILDASANMVMAELRLRANLIRTYADVPFVLANEGRLGQVFLNLLINAIEAIPPGALEEHEIRLSTSVDPGGDVVVEVRDSGTGIPQEIRASIFDPFFSTKPVGVGTGLGLSISHRIVTNLEGRIVVESAPGRGTSIRVALPPTTATVPTDAAPPELAAPSARRGRVLIVDDEPFIGATIRRLLAREHDVVVRISADEALRDVVSGTRFDVILSDLMMPNMNGMELYSAIARVAPEQAERMIFLTGGAFTPESARFLEETTNESLGKPFDGKTLMRLVRRYVGT